MADMGGRRVLARSLAGLAGLGCVACCVLPGLLVAGVLGGAGWVALGRVMPAIAVGLVALAGLAWWWASRHRTTCPPDCGCRFGSEHPPPHPAAPARRPY